MKVPERFRFYGVNIHATHLEETERFLLQYDFTQPNYVLFPDSSVIAASQHDLRLRNILNQALLTLPDGLPSAWYARSKGYGKVSTVSGFQLCQRLLASSLTHYFIGSSPETLQKIRAHIQNRFPSARVLGYAPLPFQDLSWFKDGSRLGQEWEEIDRLQPDLIWVGLSSPKQDYLIDSHAPRLRHGVLLGVGGVFDYLSGSQKKSPEWIKRIGLRWLWRLAREPRRLGPKYWAVARFYFSVLRKKKK